MDTTLSALGVGRSGRHALWHLGLACAAGGAVLEALTIAAPCAATEWLEDDDDSNASARAGTGIVIGQIIGAVGWAVAADFLGRREAIVLACVGATGTCAVAACASTPFAFEVGVAVCAASATGLFIPSLLLAVERAPVTARAGYATTLAAFVAVGSALVLGAHALLAVIAGAIASSSVGAQWRAALAFAAALPFFAGIACARGLVESPRWLLASNKHVQLRTQTRQEAARTFNGTGTPGANRVTSILDDTLRNSGDGSKPAVPAPGQACRACVGGVNLCVVGFVFLVAFGLYGITSLIRLEFASDGRNAAAPFRRRLSLSYADSEPCPAIDYGLAFSGLAFDVLFVLIARHVVDVMGRHPCLAGLAAFAGGGLLFLCIPEYFPWAKGASINLVICMMSMARGALTTAVWLTLVYSAETQGDPS
mmetsp:Transcript_10334/g.27360  ORF Transcript_10334/g.27360 Transcript_10334/m.27360 type:complete len:424 (-) Transcript_10334:19-1290(-)